MERTEYMDDLKDAPLPLRQVYAWRLSVQDKKRGMTPEQREAYYEASRKRVDAFCEKHGIKLRYAESAVTV